MFTQRLTTTTLIFAALVTVVLIPRSLAQTDPIDPTDQAATVNAAIGELLTATSEAEQIPITETAQAEQAIATETAQAQQVIATETAQAQATLAAMVTPDLTQTIDAGLQGTVAALTREARTDAASGTLQQFSSSLIFVPGGEFMMGTTVSEVAEAVRECTDVYNANCQLSYGEDSIPQHSVELAAYQIEQTEVSYRQIVNFLNILGPGSHLNGCDGQPCVETNNERDISPIQFDGVAYRVPTSIEDFPATHVTWYGASAYCEALERRLPTEAEWELAARGTDGRIYPWGNTFETSFARTRADNVVGGEPVGAYPIGASPFGVLNMAGNVAEWIYDWYGDDYYSNAPGENPQGPMTGTERVVRGGSWDAMPFFARSVHRQFLAPNFAAAWVGFRCAADVAGDVPPRNVTPTPFNTPTGTPNG
jgi:formylglycine-generating enzyme required for sulfatase activity